MESSVTKKILTRVGIIGSGHTISIVINWFFDVVLYTVAVAQFGFWGGLAIMLPLSVIINLVLIRLYDKTGKDWLGFEALKEGRENAISSTPTWLQRIIKSSDIIATTAILFYDPLLATIYLRKIEQAHKGMSRRDWKIFWLSTVLANIGWTAIVFGGISAIKYVISLII